LSGKKHLFPNVQIKKNFKKCVNIKKKRIFAAFFSYTKQVNNITKKYINFYLFIKTQKK